MDNALDYVVIALYFAVMIGAGYIGLRRARSADDYLVAGRRLGYPMYIGTLSAVVLGGASTIGGVSLGYQYGISGMWRLHRLRDAGHSLRALLAPHRRHRHGRLRLDGGGNVYHRDRHGL